MAAASEGHASPTSQVRATPGAYPSTPSDAGAPTIVSTQLSLSQAVYQRRSEFTKPYTVKVKVGTWNVASLSGTEEDIGGWFVDGKGLSESLNHVAISKGTITPEDGKRRAKTTGDVESSASQEHQRPKREEILPKNDLVDLPGGQEIGLYVLGLQEIVDVSSATEALRPYTDPHPANKWKRAIAEALPEGYRRVAEQQLIGLFLVIYASPALAPQISSVSTTSVGTGLMGKMGNKGAVTARIVLGETTRMVFINSHLSAGVEKGNLERRNWDASQIVKNTKFDPVYDGSGVMEEFGESIGDEDFAFWFGDLNYRLESLPGEDVRRLLMLHTRKEYGREQKPRKKIDSELESPRSPVTIRDGHFVDIDPDDDSSVDSSHFAPSNSLELSDAGHIEPAIDPTSLQATLSSLLPHDELHAQMRGRKAFYDGWREGPIDFLPTYKYDVGSVGVFDSSEKRRGPSWCDRILYRTRKDKLAFDRIVREEHEARRAEEQMKARGVDKEVEEEAVLFDYDPENDADNDYQDDEVLSDDAELVETKAGFEDFLHLDYYTSHQRVLSSDHKPLDAVFTLTYDAVDPQLKTKVHQEVARELDKAENEGRPIVTVVIDHHHDHEDDSSVDSPRFEGINYGHVKYHHPKSRNLTVANTGRVPATIGFIDRPVDAGQPAGVAPPWLGIRFDRASDNHNKNPGALQQFTLEPGDATNVELTLLISDSKLVQQLNEGQQKLDDVLVLRIQNGRDYFLPLRGVWLQSTFGRSIDKLIRIPEGGIRKLQHQRPDDSSHSGEVRWSAPREIFRLTETIEELVERSIAEWEMRGEDVKPPWDDIIWPFTARIVPHSELDLLEDQVREALDADRPFGDVIPPETGALQRLEAFADTLLRFLESLEDGVIPAPLWSQVEKGLVEREKSKQPLQSEEERMQILEVLSSSPPHNISFTLITFMLSRVVNEVTPVDPTVERTAAELVNSSKEGRTQHSLNSKRSEVVASYAAFFANTIIRSPEGQKDKERKASEARKKHVLELFIGGNLEENQT